MQRAFHGVFAALARKLIGIAHLASPLFHRLRANMPAEPCHQRSVQTAAHRSVHHSPFCFWSSQMFRSDQEKSSFFVFTPRTKTFSNANFRRENSARFRVSSRRPFFFFFFFFFTSRRNSAKTREETLRIFAQLLRDISRSYTAKPRSHLKKCRQFKFLFCLICGCTAKSRTMVMLRGAVRSVFRECLLQIAVS